MRLAHFIKNSGRAMFGSNLELTRYMVFYKFSEKAVVLILQKVIISNARTNKHFLDARKFTDTAKDIKIFLVICNNVFARFWSKTFFAFTQSVFLLKHTRRLTEISRRTAYIVNISFKIRHMGELFSLNHNAFFTSCSYVSALMKSN